MAASMVSVKWRDTINDRQMCKFLKKNNTKVSTKKVHVESKSIACVYGSDLYVWDHSERQLLHCNLKVEYQSDSGKVPRSSISDLAGKKEENAATSNDYQRLCLSGGVSIDVDNISANKCGSHLVLWSSKSICVVELPRRWGRNAMYEGGKDVVMCRTIMIGERTFAGSSFLRIRQVTWHPGSQTDSHLAVLTSDNMFSVYDINDPNQPSSIINVNTGDISFSYSPSKTLVSSALGELGVAFDFGLPVTLKPKTKPFQVTSNEEPIKVWPVYCVRGSGDIMLIYSHVTHFKHIKLPVQGPLKMYPPAEDNYGVDACSILCLPTPLPVIVVSTCEGRVHHCVQMPGQEEDNSLQADISTVGTPSISNVSNYEPVPEPILFVIETAELDLCLFGPGLSNLQDDDEDDFMCPIKLKKDPCNLDLYHCSHAAGVHSVALPWLTSIQQYFLDEDEDLNLPEEKQCVVEHLLCTKPLHSCPLAPVLGMDVVTDPMLGPTLLILGSDYTFTALPIGVQYQISPNTGVEPSDSSSKTSTQRKPRELFGQYIAQLLQRKASVPLLKAGPNVDMSQQECFLLLGRATQVLREEYIHKQDHARHEIDTRINVLRQHKEHQLQDLKQLMDSKLLLRETAQSLAEKLEATKERHESLVRRLENVLHKIQSRVPVLSEAEKQMGRELAKLKDNIPLYSQNIEQVRMKQEYQGRQMKKAATDQPVVLKEKQLSQIRGILKEESNEIQELKRDISRLSIEIS